MINYAVIETKSTYLRIKLSPDLFNLTLLTMLQEVVGVDQKRLLIDQAFQIVLFFDSDCLREASEEGAWSKIADNRIMRELTDSIAGKREMTSLGILSMLILDLSSLIKKIDREAVALCDTSKQQMPPKTPDTCNLALATMHQIQEALEFSEIGTSLMNQCLQKYPF